MAEPQRCPRCRITRFGICRFCFPAEAEQERRAELAADLAAEEDRRRRDAGLLHCPAHEIHDGCYRVCSISEARAELRSEERLSWQQAMSELRRRYAGP